MDLSGQLQDMPLVNLLQQLQSQQASGALELRGGFQGEQITLGFHGGDLVHVFASHRPGPMKLGALVVFGELAENHQVCKALKTTSGGVGGARLGDALQAMNLVLGEFVEDLLRVQFKNDVLRAALWPVGTYHFEPTPIPVQSRLIEPIPTRELVRPLLRVVQNWSQIQGLVPTRRIGFRRVQDGPIPERLRAPSGPIEPDDERVYMAIAPTLSVHHLLAVTRMSPIEVLPALLRLSDADLISLSSQARNAESEVPNPSDPNNLASASQAHLVPPDLAMPEGGGVTAGTSPADHLAGTAATKTVVQRAQTRTLGQSIAFHGATTVLVIALLAITLRLFLSAPDESTDAAAVVEGTSSSGRAALTQSQIVRIRNALGVYRLKNGDYPTRLDLLVDQGLLRPRDLTYPNYQKPYIYRPQGDTFILIRPKK